jgi:hypothetical protein
MRTIDENFLQPGSIPGYLINRGLFPFYSAETQMSIGVLITGNATTTGE